MLLGIRGGGCGARERAREEGEGREETGVEEHERGRVGGLIGTDECWCMGCKVTSDLALGV